VLLERHLLDDVLLGAGVQRDAEVELDDPAVLDRDVVVAVVADTGTEPLAVDDVAVQVDGDVRSADDEAVPETVGDVVLDDDALLDHLTAVDLARNGRGADTPPVRGRRRIDVSGRILGANAEDVLAD
jgi:hypothetical protein